MGFNSAFKGLTSALDGVGGQRHALAASPRGQTRYPLYRKLGGPQDRYGRVRKISPSPGFDPRAAHPVASRCTDCAIPAALYIMIIVFSSDRMQIHRIDLGSCDFILPIYFYDGGPQVFQNSRNCLKIPIARRVTRRKFHTGKGKVHPCTGTEALYRPYGP